MKVIVTGFNAFGGADANPSQEAVSQLPSFVKIENNGEQVKVAKLTLETCCIDGWSDVRKEVENSPDEDFAIVLCGVAGGRDKICLERFALNVRKYPFADNKDHTWDDDRIHEDGPDALRSKLPLREMLAHLNERGYACDISNHAGTYVCNETYYRCMTSWQDDPRCKGILFVHVPNFDDYKHTEAQPDEKRSPQEIYTACFESIIEFIGSMKN